MKIKRIVTISLGVVIVIVFFIMAVGLLVPDSVLKNLSLSSSTGETSSKISDSTSNSTSTTPESISTNSNTTNSGTGGSTSDSPSSNTATCGSGGTCTLAKDVTPYTSQSDCRMAINSGVSGQPSMGIYKIPSSFLSTHAAEKSISRFCGQTLNMNLKNAVNKHSNGSSLGGSNYDQWIKNFYFASL